MVVQKRYLAMFMMVLTGIVVLLPKGSLFYYILLAFVVFGGSPIAVYQFMEKQPDLIRYWTKRMVKVISRPWMSLFFYLCLFIQETLEHNIFLDVGLFWAVALTSNCLWAPVLSAHRCVPIMSYGKKMIYLLLHCTFLFAWFTGNVVYNNGGIPEQIFFLTGMGTFLLVLYLVIKAWRREEEEVDSPTVKGYIHPLR